MRPHPGVLWANSFLGADGRVSLITAGLHNDPGFIYTCKICTDLNENTNLKTPVSPQPSDSKSPKSLLVLPEVSASGSAAADILEEECGSDCNVCHTRIDEPPNRCDYCQSECHDCMVHASDSGEICLSCAASQTQIDESRQTTHLHLHLHCTSAQSLLTLMRRWWC